jgi:type IV fimbrial biogenesis protein FimT
MIELVITMAILGILIVVAMPSLSAWVQGARMNSIADFYLDGLRLARNGALQKSGASRFVLTANANGQYDWQVDWCFPTSVLPCDAGGAWSTTVAAAAGDSNVANPSLSVFHSGNSQPSATLVTTSLTPANTLSVYFNSQGWVNTAAQPILRRMRFDSAASYNPNPTLPNIRPIAVAINLSGIAERCDPMVAAGDSRACSP